MIIPYFLVFLLFFLALTQALVTTSSIWLGGLEDFGHFSCLQEQQQHPRNALYPHQHQRKSHCLAALPSQQQQQEEGHARQLLEQQQQQCSEFYSRKSDRSTKGAELLHHFVVSSQDHNSNDDSSRGIRNLVGRKVWSSNCKERRVLLATAAQHVIVWGGGLFVAGSVTPVLGPAAASAVSVVPEPQQVTMDKENILHGYKRLSYLLDHWEEETTICGRTDNPYVGNNKGCERTPIKVMEYMGYKSMKDPLFRADKTMRRLEFLVSANRESDYIDAIELWNESAEEASNMAYVSSWAEANPGGGKDRTEYFIERAKKNVMDAHESLRRVIDILKLQ